MPKSLLKLVDSKSVPVGAVATVNSLMPKISLVIEKEQYSLRRNNVVVQNFNDSVDALTAYTKLFNAAFITAQKFYRSVAGGKDKLLPLTPSKVTIQPLPPAREDFIKDFNNVSV